ncbi:DUF6801 domain-containing protein [Amycolatopsis minnesotensis]|uniref:DUF6801 domain-containing protein n=1 Tax=Amycolatopsis minnesotensis TaxID=337894 RepID=A0ABP5DNR5_9PSEU
MSRKLGRAIAVSAAVAAAVSMSVVGTASAATTITYKTGDTNLSCSFPLIGNQPVLLKAQFDAPDAVSTGNVITPANVKATATISAALHNTLTNLGYNGVQGHADAQVTSVGLSPSPAALANLTIPTQTYPAGGAIDVNINDTGATIPAFTVTGAAGTQASVTLSGTFNAPIELLKTAGGSTPWTMKCTIKSGTPAFSPNVTIS